MKKAICLLSGGLDSTTALYVARHNGYDVAALTIHYGQLHAKEIDCAKIITADLGLEHEIVRFDLPWKGSALLDFETPIPTGREESQMMKEIPTTYVPARNTIFLSFAASYAEVRMAETIFIGANALDYSGYPDCRPDYIDAFNVAIRKGTKAGADGKTIRVEAPLIMLSKKDIVNLAISLKVPLEKTWSCYQGRESPCGECDSCQLRAKGFREAGVSDPLIHYALSGHR